MSANLNTSPAISSLDTGLVFKTVFSPVARESLSIASYFQSHKGSLVETSAKAKDEVKVKAKVTIKVEDKAKNETKLFFLR